MTNLLGEFEVTLDVKGRVMLPVALKRQLPKAAKNRFVVNRGFEGCLVLYPKNEWDLETARINQLNLYVRENREFVRAFMNGATEVTPDGSGRLLLPKTLLEFAGISKDAIFFAYSNRIEVWNRKTYIEKMKTEPNSFAELAERVMGTKP